MTLIYFMGIAGGLTWLLNAAFVVKPQSREAYRFYLFAAFLLYMGVTVLRPLGPGLGGTDTWGYRNYFLRATHGLGNALTIQTYEKGYAFFIWVVRLFTTEYRVVLFLVHGFIFYSTVVFLKSLRYNRFFFITVMALVFLALNSINIVRIIVAVAVSYHIYPALRKDQFWKAFGLALVAFSMHISAIFVFGILFVYIVRRHEENFSIDQLMVLCVVLIVTSFLVIHFMDAVINQTKYIFYDKDEAIAFPSYVMFLVTFLLGLMKHKELNMRDTFNDFLLYALPIGLIILPLQFRYAIMYRMLLFVHPVLFALMPEILEVNQEGKLVKWAIYLILGCFVLYRIYGFFNAEMFDLGSF